MKRTLLLTTLILAVLATGRAQCPDFTDLNGSGVACWTNGDVVGSNNGPIPERYAVVTQQGMDPYTGYQLPILPAGESAVVRLGNDQGGMQSEGIDYNFVVDPDYPILTIKYAFVMRNYGDISSGCPSFGIFVLQPDSEIPLMSQSIYPCGQYAFNDLQNHDEVHVTGTVIWRQWTTICIDVSNYAGQQIRVRFVTNDGMHNQSAFSYAYFTASCMSDHLTVVGCDGNDIILSAPEGYALYEWNNGATTQTTSYPIDEGLDVACTLASAHGCMPVLTSANIEGLSITQGAVYYDTICQGESYQEHGFNLPPQNEVGNFTIFNLAFDATDCSSGEGTTLQLTVLQRYFHYYEEACEGTDYDNHGFHYTNLQPGLINDSLPIVLSNGCDTGYRYLHLTVNPTIGSSGEIYGDTSVCDNQMTTYTLHFDGNLNYYIWSLPDGVYNFAGDGLSYVNLYFTEEVSNPAVISVAAGNLCGSHTFSLSIWHAPAYYQFFEDTVCVGSAYNLHGIQTALLDSIGLFFLSQHNISVSGCDSDVTVRLVVAPTPTVSTLAQPEDLCAGENTTIHALGVNAVIGSLYPQQVLPGDILCTDSTIVKPADWPVPGKTAKAVIFFVDSTGQHGWAVHLHDQGNFPWGNGYLPESSGLSCSMMNPNYILDGKLNTQKLRLFGDASSFPAVWAVDFDNGWYLPSIGQLILIFFELSAVNSTLSLVNGSPFTPSPSTDLWINMNYCYWSSTPATFSNPNLPASNNPANPWFNDIFNQTSVSGGSGQALRVRSIIDF